MIACSQVEKEIAVRYITGTSEEMMTMHARGQFDVTLTPPDTESDAETATLGRLLINKQFHGDLDATSKGQMLAVQTDVEGSAGYVALEKVSGTLQGRRGSFVLQHSGIMDRGQPQLSVTVIPDSGTEQLVGLTGKMEIIIEGGTHFYEFEYSLASA